MSNKRWLAAFIGVGLVILLLAGALVFYPVLIYGPGWMMGGYGYGSATPYGYYGHGMMRGYGPGGMMGYQGYTNQSPYGNYGRGMMGGYGPGGMMGGYGPGGMMGGYGPGSMMGHGMMGYGMMGGIGPFANAKPLTLAEATEAVETYLAKLNDGNLELGEVMVFDNHAYAQIVEQDGGIGAMEVLVDPVTKAVYPEMGPNMMWNLKYGMMSGFGGHGMMGYFGYNNTAPAQVSAEMPVTSAKAVEAVQAYLDAYVGSNLTADNHVDPFYGYYTLHVNRAGETIGMLSVNGYTGQVFLHTWHGNLIEMSEGHAE